MTIANSSSSGIVTATLARGTTTYDVPYVGVAAGSLAILSVIVRPSTNVPTILADDGWTLIVNVTGGAGSGVDSGLTRMCKWYKVLDGTETGNVTVSNVGGSGNMVHGVMDVYTKTGARWGVTQNYASGDVTNAANFSGTTATLGTALAAGDLVHVGFALNTDATSGITVQVASQSGTTFSARSARSRLGSSDGEDGTIYTYDCTVTTASPGTGALTVGATYAATSSGAGAVTVLREISSINALSTLSDNFAAGSINTSKWSDSYGTYAQTGGRIEITCSTTYSALKSNSSSTLYAFDQVSAYTEPPPLNSGVGVFADFVYQAVGQADGTDVGFYNDINAGTIAFVSRTGFFDATAAATTITYVHSTMAYKRMRLSGSKLLFETSPDGYTWTVRRTMTAPVWLMASQGGWVYFETHRDNAGTGGTYYVDSFNTLPVSGAVDLQWKQSNVAAASSDLRWAVTSAVTASTDLRWRSLGSVTGSLDVRWAVKSIVTASSDLRWGVASVVTGTTDIRWISYGSVTNSTDLRWLSLVQVTGSRDLRWAVASIVSGSSDLRWAVLATVSAAMDYRWRSLVSISNALDARWAVTNSVTSSVDLRWGVASSVTGSTDFRWISYGSVTGTTDLRWIVDSSNLTATQSADLRWRVSQSVTSSVDLRWLVTGQISNSTDLRWAVRAVASGTVDTRWRVSSVVTASLDARWAVRTEVPRALDLRWTSYAQATNSADLRWRTSGSVSSPIALVWSVRGAVSGTLDLRWGVRSQISGSLDLRWRSRTLMAAAIALRWISEAAPLAEEPTPNAIRAHLTSRITSRYPRYLGIRSTQSSQVRYPEEE